MKQYSYDELQKMVADERKKKSPILGSCCNCNIDILKTDKHTTHFLYPQGGVEYQFACEKCEGYEIELKIFLSLLCCVQGNKSWEIFRQLKDK